MYLDLFTYLLDDFKALADDMSIPSLYCAYFFDTFQRLRRWAALFAGPQRREAPAYHREHLGATAD